MLSRVLLPRQVRLLLEHYPFVPDLSRGEAVTEIVFPILSLT